MQSFEHNSINQAEIYLDPTVKWQRAKYKRKKTTRKVKLHKADHKLCMYTDASQPEPVFVTELSFRLDKALISSHKLINGEDLYDLLLMVAWTSLEYSYMKIGITIVVLAMVFSVCVCMFPQIKKCIRKLNFVKK